MSADLRRQARGSTLDYVDAVVSALARPGTPWRGSSPSGTRVAGPALAQLQNQTKELADLGQHVEGRPRVLSSVVTARTKSPATMTVAACLDNSRVKVVGRGGRPLPQPATADKPTLNILTLRLITGTWVVTGQTFPDDPDC